MANANWGKKTRQINAKNIKKFALPMQIGKKTCQIDAKNIKKLALPTQKF